MRKLLLQGVLLTLMGSGSYGATAQSTGQFGFEYWPGAKVVHGSETLPNAWAGGLNSPQFSNLDLNADQQPDLVVFDRANNRVLPFLSVATATGRGWQFAPDYAALFPADLYGWVLLRDYDCDGRPDLFTADASGSNIRVFRHMPDASGRPGFQLVTPMLTYNDAFGPVNIATGGYNTPAIEDVDGDGRLDVLTYDFAATSPSIYYYRNTTATGCGGLELREASSYWGEIIACLSGCGSFTFAPDRCRPLPRPAHTGGYNIALFDLDGDGDKDLLTGRDNCPELTVLRNDGTAQTARFSSAGSNALAPFNTTPVRLPNFPAAYPVDVTFDGRPDLVVAANLYDNTDTIETRQSVRLYRNAGTAAAPSLVREQLDFLQHDMLEVSEMAAPAFGDIDGDGLVDMLLGGVSRNNAKGFYRAGLSYYRNTGTRTAPVFQLMTTDYLGLMSRKLGFIKPILVDLNRDGAVDLVYSSFARNSTDNPITYVLNTAKAGQPVAFDVSTAATFANMPQRAFDMPAFADINGDGLVDMLLGTNANSLDYPGQSLRYYRNTGATNLRQAFTVQDNDFGRLRTSTGARPTYLSPIVADFDGDGRPDLLTADTYGDVQLFSDVRAQAQVGAFLGRSDVFYNVLTKQFQPGQWGRANLCRYSLAAADVDGDGAPELFLGLESGGVVSFQGRNRVVTATQAAQPSLGVQLYPNPATFTATLEAAQPVRVTVLDLAGRVVRPAAAAARTHQLPVAGLAAGIYLVRCQALTGETTVRRLEVK
ncbi:T9SS type A sorting domain-containing protein [Hymenobacter pini]|uniref:T9SS type A sorting domain-containing protein n=1 Tax=Hymenobacter pini TaxID=2880879 RepID=UPI001CF5B059|nr:T9SS type A sorting domain-containing protein [Hymenobacter pini]MCA8832024.1 T9SS type A sorting domain-containing protein [Hymenobacter pini]